MIQRLLTRSTLLKTGVERIWPTLSLERPPSSPDLNPLDFSIWGILEARVNAKCHRSIESLNTTFLKEWDRLSMQHVRAAIDSWSDRLRATVKANGGRFE